MLYDKKHHEAFMSTLSRLKFDVCFLSYKRRHNEPEQLFFELLSEWCDVYEVRMESGNNTNDKSSNSNTNMNDVTGGNKSCIDSNSSSSSGSDVRFSNVIPKMRGGLYIFKIIRKNTI